MIEDIKRKPGMMIYFDFLDNVIDSCSTEEIGQLIIAAYRHHHGINTKSLFQDDPKLLFIYGTMLNSLDRDTEKYFEECFRRSINKRFSDWKKAKGADDSSRERWETENADMINKIHCEYLKAKFAALGQPDQEDTEGKELLNRLYKERFPDDEEFHGF